MNTLAILALLLVCPKPSLAQDLVFPEDFSFGVATAPGHAEDGLDDIWLDWARAGKIRAYSNHKDPEKRLNAWSDPETEIKLYEQLGLQAVRLGVDWGRIMPSKDRFDEEALTRYRSILRSIRGRNIKIMLSLFHHSVPKWVQNQGGWKNPETTADFVRFSKKILTEFHGEVDWWITFNEPQVFALLAYQAGLWPPGETASFTSLLDLPFFCGGTVKAILNMVEAHREFYDSAHRDHSGIKIGVAQHFGDHKGASLVGKILARFTGRFMNWFFLEQIQGKMDFIGMNYYGAEWISARGVEILDDEEYSEAGRAVYPSGLSRLMKEAHERYHLPVLITENGIADSTDWIRPAYLSEHLAAIHDALSAGVPVKGYFLWTLSDNLEWTDGYCPKFGLVEVKREENLKRIPRGSFSLYSSIVKTRTLTAPDREKAWSEYQSHVGQNRPFCRASDGKNGLDSPMDRKIPSRDWRFR